MDQLNTNTDGWEIAVDRLNLREPIVKEAFGSVWRALLGRSTAADLEIARLLLNATYVSPFF